MRTPAPGCQVRHDTLCAPLTDAQLTPVEAIRLHDQAVPRGTDIFRSGERCQNFYTIKDGWVMLYGLLSDGRRHIHKFALPGAFLGHQTDAETPMGSRPRRSPRSRCASCRVPRR